MTNAMTLELIPLSKIQPSPDNPRKCFDTVTIKGLAASIKADGLLQNLVLSKPKGRKKSYTIIAGERRYRAMALLVERGELSEDFAIPAEIKDGLSEQDVRRIATIENVQRENLPPIEEAEAVASLLQDGMMLDDVVAKTGLSESTIKRRLALSNLCDEAKAVLASGEISLSQAEALTLGTDDQQRELIGEGIGQASASRIKQWLTDEKPNVALALFDKERYSGAFTSDLFADDETTYFDDADQFWILQNEAIETLAQRYRETGFDPVEIAECHSHSSWQYRPARDDETGGVVIEVRLSGRVDIHEGIVSRDLDQDTASETTDNPFAEKSRPKYSRPVCEYIAFHKTMAVQAAMLEDPRVAKEVAVAQMIGGHDWLPKILLKTHRCLEHFAGIVTPPSSFEVVESVAKALSSALGKNVDDADAGTCLDLIHQHGIDGTRIYEAVKVLTDEELDRLHLLLTTLCFGQGDCDRLDTDENSFFNRVARDLRVDMRENWTADEAFLSRRSKEQLLEIIAETDASGLFGNAAGFKKADIVRMLAKHFNRVRTVEKPNVAERTARDWVPEAFAFPAIDSDQPVETPMEAADLAA